jgi:hypothetical protein
MLHLFYAPISPLLDFVDNFWLYDGYTQPHFKERILPSGTIELVINLRDDELRIYDAAQPERCNRFSGALVSGAYGGFFVIDTAEEVSIMGVHFKAGGAFPFLGIPDRPTHRPQPATVHPGLHGGNRHDAETLLPRATVSTDNSLNATDHGAGLGAAGSRLRVFRPVTLDPRLSHVPGLQPLGLPPPTELSPSAWRVYQT